MTKCWLERTWGQDQGSWKDEGVMVVVQLWLGDGGGVDKPMLAVVVQAQVQEVRSPAYVQVLRIVDEPWQRHILKLCAATNAILTSS